ncbi:hypothetical protein ACFP2F_11030 [Hymenobacter artigasi]|uniref:Drug/metabolite transporter (DMT)-like permease n=1 Tax=Hymenobacter artigasi TaxID=2719616 RepID=A0ABX1HJW4_9BACT|nr:hypothetical protein [Hymenobacter artigasi]NKI90194.1 drug/metabolite transporter (DMT)-like permease [Hymenobacter artigasi]
MMTRTEQFVLRYNAWIILVAAVGYNLSVEHLMDRSYTAPSLLLYRGLAGVVFIVIIAWRQGISLVPQVPQTQVVRFLNSGIAVLLAFEAFHRLAGVTVATIQRLDVPFAVIIGVVLGQRLRDSKFGLSVLALAIVLSSFFFAGKIDEDPAGLALAILAVAMTSIAYLLGKKSLTVENNLTVLNTTNLGCVGVGLLVCVLRGQFSQVHLADLWLFGVITITQFILNYVMAILFRHHDVTRAQRPYLLSAVVILLLEMLTEHKLFAPLHILFVLLVVGVVYLITLTKAPSLLWPDAQVKTKPEQTVAPA